MSIVLQKESSGSGMFIFRNYWHLKMRCVHTSESMGFFPRPFIKSLRPTLARHPGTLLLSLQYLQNWSYRTYALRIRSGPGI